MSASERRAHPRQPTNITIELRDHRNRHRAVEISGVTKNVSRGGVLAVLDHDVALGAASNCLIRFKDVHGQLIAPDFRWGVALRSHRVDGRQFEVAIVFEKPLEPSVVESLCAPPRRVPLRVV